MSCFSKSLECPICLTQRQCNLIVCKAGHGACAMCSSNIRTHDSRCPMCRGALLRTFIPNLPLDGAVNSLSDLEEQLERERHSRDETVRAFEHFKSCFEKETHNKDKPAPANKRPRHDPGAPSTLPPTERQLEYARSLANRHQVDLPPEALADRSIMSAWIGEHK